MVVKSKDPVMAMRGNDGDSHHTVSTKNMNHKVQRPNSNGPDPILHARSPHSSRGLKRQGSIGVSSGNDGGGGANNGNDISGSLSPTSILKEGRLSPRGLSPPSGRPSGTTDRFFPTMGNNHHQQHGGRGGGDDSSLESIGVIEDGMFQDVTDSLSTLGDTDQRRVRWGPSVKAASSRGGCHAASGLGFDKLKSLIGNLSEMTMKNVSRLDGTAHRLGKGLEGLGMKCTGGGKLLCTACDNAFDNQGPVGLGKVGRCTQCGINDGLDGGLFVFEGEANDLAGNNHSGHNHSHSNHNHDNNEKNITMHEALLETRDAIKESRDAIVASRDAILGSYEEMRESRECVEDSRYVMHEFREAAAAMSRVQQHQIQNRHALEEDSMLVSGRSGVEEETAKLLVELGRGSIADIARGGDDPEELTSPARRKKGEKNYYNSPVETYRHSSSSLRASVNNIETGVGNDNYMADEQDPFRSPRTTGTTNNSGTQKAASPPPVSILRKKQSMGTQTNRRTPPTSPANSISKLIGRRNKDKRYHFTTKAATVAAAAGTAAGEATAADARPKSRSKTSSADNKNNKNNSNKRFSMSSFAHQDKRQTVTITKKPTQEKKKNISRLVIGGLKKPMKFVSQGVKSSNFVKKSRGPKRIFALTSGGDGGGGAAQHLSS